MSDINAIRKTLKPWTGRDGKERYYVNDWKARIGDDVSAYMKLNGMKTSSEGKVWYDTYGHAHADRFEDYDLACFIERTMERTQFLKPGEKAEHPFRTLEWAGMLRSVPHEFVPSEPGSDEGVMVFHRRGRDYYVERGYLQEQMRTNKAYLDVEGRLLFESEASDLDDLVRSLAEGESEDDGYEECGWIDSPMYDDYFSDESEDWMLPKSRWTKGKVMEYCRIEGVPDKAMKALERMTLDDIKACFLVNAGTMMTGSPTDAERQRHTMFYLLDLKSIRNLGRIAV